MSNSRLLRAVTGPTESTPYESRDQRLRRLRAEVQTGTYKVDPDRLALAILAHHAEKWQRAQGLRVDGRLAS